MLAQAITVLNKLKEKMMEKIRESLENGQFKQALEQMGELRLTFKELLQEYGIRCRDIAILADMKIEKDIECE